MATPVQLFDQELSARKQFLETTHRTVPPTETLKRLKPHFKAAGVTRLADITKLDRVGIPTILAHRPNCPTLSNAAGKGFDTISATVSAAMEAVEIFHAESPQIETTYSSWEKLPEDARIPPHQLPLTFLSLFKADKPYHWVRSWDLVQQKVIYVPYSSVAMEPPKGQRIMIDRAFEMGTNGLAGGNHLLESITAGLYEVIERDAVACSTYAGLRVKDGWKRVQVEVIDDPRVQDLVRRLEEAQLSVFLADCSVDTKVPTYMSLLFETESRHAGGTKGYGAHLDPNIAIIRAITEAVQARLIFIAGSRDDFFRREQANQQLADDKMGVSAFLDMPFDEASASPANSSNESFEEDVYEVLERLKAVGIESVLVVNLTRPEIDIPVVKVIVPGLEGYMFEDYEAGPRAKSWLSIMERAA